MQNCTSLSTTEAEYIAAAEACKEAIWLTCLIRDLGMTIEMATLHCDSQSAIEAGKRREQMCSRAASDSCTLANHGGVFTSFEHTGAPPYFEANKETLS